MIGRRSPWRLATLALVGCLVTGASQAEELSFPTYIWTDGPSGDVLIEFSQAFETDNSGVTVPNANVPFDQFFDKQFVAVSAGSPPDIVTLFDPDIKKYIEAGVLEPLDEYIEAAGYSLDSLNRALDAAKQDGKLYAISYENNPRALLYNEKLLKDAGVEPPTNLDELYQALKALRNPETGQFGLFNYSVPTSAARLFNALHPFVIGFGAQWTTNGKATANSERMVELFEFYKKIYDEGLIPRVKSSVGRQMLVDNKLAMLPIGPFVVGAVQKKNPDTYKNLRSMPLPFPGGTTSSTTVFLGVPKNAKNKDLAIKFLMTWLQDNWQLRSLDHMRTIPTRPEVIPADFAKKNKWADGFLKAYPVAKSPAPEGAEEYGPEIAKIIQRHFEAMLFNDAMTPAEAANAIQNDLEAFLASKS